MLKPTCYCVTHDLRRREQCYSSSENYFTFSLYKIWAQSLQFSFSISIYIISVTVFYRRN